jgi:RES domain-containing protein
MNIVVWRIVQRRFAKFAFSGEGARRFGGRWNSPGHRVIYTAESQSLAALEMLVHLDSELLLQNYFAIPVTISARLIQHFPTSALPKNWRTYPAPPSTRALGDAWLLEDASPVLQVPSAVIASESNFLLNPAHPLFRKLRIGKPTHFHFDPRLSNQL